MINVLRVAILIVLRIHQNLIESFYFPMLCVASGPKYYYVAFYDISNSSTFSGTVSSGLYI